MRDYKGKEADVLVTRIDPGVVSLVADLRGHEQQAAEESERWIAHHEERKPLDASPAAITLALLLTDEELDSLEKSAGDGEIARGGRPGGSNVASPQPAARRGQPAQESHANAAPPDGRPRVDGVIGLESDPRRGRRAPQMGDRASADALRWNLDLILDQRGADMADLPRGASGLLVRDYKGKNADRLVTWIDTGVVSLLAELRGHERRPVSRSASPSTYRRRRSRSPCC
ncbi:MAG TPA: hypothetical protein VF311_04105 [Terriglobales bacterium]